MPDTQPTYSIEGDEIFAIHEGAVIASGTNFAAVEGDAIKYLDGLKTNRDQVAKDDAKKKASHIITPNGVEGEILGRTPSVWGEQVTVRFANGTITTIDAHGEMQWVTKRKEAAANPADGLEQRLAADYSHDRQSLTDRLSELREIADNARHLAAQGAPYLAELKLDEVRTAAEFEASQVKEAIDHLDSADAEAFTPEAPFAPRVVEQADLGHSDSWLDVTTQEMIDESEGQDFDQILDEGPSMFVTDLDGGALADQGATREMALAHITSKTAGFAGEEIEDYREKFVARTEVARRHELAARKETNHKEAAAQQEVQSNAPDEALFM